MSKRGPIPVMMLRIVSEMGQQPQPVHTPIPVEPIGFSNPLQIPRPPGIVTALGIFCLILACLGMLANLYMGLMTAGFWMASAMTSRGAFTPPTATVTPAQTGQFSPHGMDATQRALTIAGFRRAHPFTPQQVEQIDALLADSGKDIILMQGSSLTVDSVKANVSDSGKTAEGGDFLILGQGRLEVSDTRAVFMPADGTPNIVVENGVPKDPNTQPKLTDAQIDAIVSHVQSSQFGNVTLNSAQAKGFAGYLKGAGSTLFMPAADVPGATSQLRWAGADSAGDVTVMTMLGTASIDTKGNVTGTGTAGPAMVGTAMSKINTTAAAFSALAALASFFLAVFVMVVGIFVLRQSPRTRMLLKIYGITKIPVEIVAGISGFILFESFTSGFGAGAATPGLVMWWTIFTLLWCTFPLIVLILLRTRAMKDYFEAGVL